MSLFKQNKVDSLRKKSSNILGVFQRTITDLAAVNMQIGEQIAERQERIAALLDEKSLLDTQQEQNTKIIAKVSRFLNLD